MLQRPSTYSVRGRHLGKCKEYQGVIVVQESVSDIRSRGCVIVSAVLQSLTVTVPIDL